MKTLFLDVDTQFDFVSPSGALYVPGAEAIVPAVAKLNRWAKAQAIPLLSTADAHAENDPEFRFWPPHCIAGTLGQHKLDETLVGQPVLNKQTLDCFEIPSFLPTVTELGADHCVVYGVVTEICVKIAAMGLLKTGRRVTIVTDAVKALSPAAAQQLYDEFTASGGDLSTVDSVCR